MIDTNIFKKQLETTLEKLISDLQEIATQNKQSGDWIAVPVSGDVGNADDNIAADTTEEWNERRATTSKLETMYQNQKRALDKIEAGTYGVCEICGAKIESDRLEANPAARTCKTHLEEEGSLSL